MFGYGKFNESGEIRKNMTMTNRVKKKKQPQQEGSGGFIKKVSSLFNLDAVCLL